jgi:mRNA interferase MazF
MGPRIGGDSSADAARAVKAFEIWWAALPEPIGTRPIMLLTRDGAYSYLSRALAVEITSVARSIPQELPLGAREGLPQRCVANFDNLRAVPITALRDRIGRLAPGRVRSAKRALGYALGWSELVTLDE